MIYLISKNTLRLTVTFFLMVPFTLFSDQQIGANFEQSLKNNSQNYLSSEILEEVRDYLIADDHPIKKKLDKIFSNQGVLAHLQSMEKAGFELIQSKHLHKIIVAKHRKIPGVIIKAYLDKSPKERSHYTFLIRRIRGSQLVEESIKRHHYSSLFKTPKKWLYRLPDLAESYEDDSRTIFIIVEDELDVIKEKKNEKRWKSALVTQELLEALYTVMTEVGLGDVKPRNCPFCGDGKIAFIDTESCETTPKHEKLLPYLLPLMAMHWSNLNIKKDL